MVEEQYGITGLASDAKELLGNPLIAAVSGAVIGSAVTGAAIAGASAIKKKRRKTSSKKRKSPRRYRKRKTYNYARTAGKGKDTSTRRIRMTKNGQPYVILKSGKARFIKKSSARLSRKRKGGRY